MKDRYQSWSEAEALAKQMREQALARLSRPKASPPPPPDKPRIEGIVYTPPTKE